MGSADTRLISGNLKFGFKLFGKLVDEDGNQNIFISPSSIAMALAMTYNGAAGETQQAMAETLEFQGMSLQEINNGNAVFWATLASPDPNVQLSIANSLWVRKGIQLRPEFIKISKEFFGADVTNMDFTDSKAPLEINTWVKRRTTGKIDKIVDVIERDTLMYLINAIYFKGTWTKIFDKKETREGVFTLLDGRQKRQLMMAQSGYYRYYQADNFQAVSLPYGDGRVSLYLFLPNKDYSLGEFLRSLNTGNWESWISRFDQREGTILLPRFRLEYEVELNRFLKALGMEIVFDPDRADFSRLCSTQGAAIRKVKHKTFVEVNEQGTEAAAVTSVEIVATSSHQSSDPFKMILDRPFVCVVRDNKTGAILFMGSIVEPK